MTLLEDLWYGNLSPADRRLERGSLAVVLQNQAADAEHRLTQTLSQEQKQLFLAYESTQSHISATWEADAFARGFRLAVRLLSEALQSSER